MNTWRDEKISTWHRKIGINAPVTDIDLLVGTNTACENTWVEFDNLQPVCLIDYKHEYATINFSGASVMLQRNLANRANIGFYIVRYSDQLDWFDLIPQNKFAVDEVRNIAHDPKSIVQGIELRLTEKQFVNVLYKLRGREIPVDVLEGFDQ